MPTARQIRAFIHNLTRLLDANHWGEALALASQFFFRGEDSEQKRAMARFLARTLCDLDGSLDGTADFLREWARMLGGYPVLTADVVERNLLRMSEEDTTALIDELCQAIHARTWAAHQRRKRFVVHIDEFQTLFQGAGAKMYQTAKEYRENAKTEAGRNVTALKTGRSYATTVGNEYTVMTTTMKPEGNTQALSFKRRHPLLYTRAGIVRHFLDCLRRLKYWPQWILIDRGFLSYDSIGELCRFARDSAGQTDFIIPVSRPKFDPTDAEEPRTDFLLNGLPQVANKGWNPNKARRIPGTNHWYYQEPRRIPNEYTDVEANLVIIYFLKPGAETVKSGEWIFDKHIGWYGFACFRKQTDDTIRQTDEAYIERWDCENYYQRLGFFMTILPSKSHVPRVMSFGLALIHANIYGLQRTLRRERAADFETSWLRVKSFFRCASRQLENQLDPLVGSRSLVAAGLPIEPA